MPDCFPRPRRRMIYAYTTPDAAQKPWQDGKGIGHIKVGQTERDVNERIREQLGAATPDKNAYSVLLKENAVLPAGFLISDKDVHHVLEHQIGRRRVGGEWFEATEADVKAAIKALVSGERPEAERSESFGLRDEQAAAVAETAAYFRRRAADKGRLKFLWNAKMRFGKTFTTYKLAQEMGWKRLLVLTYKPAVQDAWEEDLRNHRDFKGWSFIGNRDTFSGDEVPEQTVWMSSYQAIFSKTGDGLSPERLALLFETQWDAVVIDEYHYGAHRENAKDLFDDAPEVMDEDLVAEIGSGARQIRADHYLHLSGTPFRALNAGEFQEDEIFNWSYTDEQRAKAAWPEERGPNPYASLPQMVMMTYKLPQRIIEETEEDALDLDSFFAAEVSSDVEGREVCRFRNEAQVGLWLDFICGIGLSRDELSEDEKNRSPMPFKDSRLHPYLDHTFWFLPSVAACKAMAGLLETHTVFRSYKSVVAAGYEAGIGIDALPPVRAAIKANKQTITLSCGKLTTGITVPEWTAVFMLRGMQSPESYFQTAFRAQSPRVVRNPKDPADIEVLKDRCYIFDFDPRRALSLAAQYCYDLDRAIAEETSGKSDLEARMEEFLEHLPVLCHINGVMEELSAGAAIDIVSSGTGTAMLARRFMSPKMVRINLTSMNRLKADEELVERLKKIESFRNLGNDLERITGELERTEKGQSNTSEKPKKEEKKPKLDAEITKLMKELRDNLLKFIARLPVFMYINDEREKTALEVIETTGDELFYKATGITKADFRRLLDLGVFDDAYLNDAIRAFKQVEDNALVYLGDRKIAGAYVAAWNTHVERVE